MRWVLPELNHPEPGGMLFVGRDPGAQEMARGRPFVGDAGATFDAMLRAAGIARTRVNIVNVVGVQPPGNDFKRHRREDVKHGVHCLHGLIAKLAPNVVVAMGNEAAHACVPGWPDARVAKQLVHRGDIYGARDIQRRRGYLWSGVHGAKVLTTLHPSAVMRDASGISEMLTTADFAHAREESADARLLRPSMEIIVVRTLRDAWLAQDVIVSAGIAACDIEITSSYPYGVRCVAFAPTAAHAYVFVGPALAAAYDLLRSRLRTVWQNGQFDINFLATRAGVHVAGELDDIIVAWHTRWPEIAGAALDVDNERKGSKRTNKSLAFFASLYSNAAWWKDYNVDDEGMYRLCGQDACLTMLTHGELQQELAAMQLQSVYELTMQRVRPVAAMQARGILIHEGRRRDAVRELSARKDEALLEIASIARPLLEAARERVAKPELIWKRTVCSCCRNGSGKREACTSCAGLPTKLTKAILLERYVADVRANGGSLSYKAARIAGAPKLSVAALKEELLRPCKVCNGEGAWETYAFNPASNEQLSTLLYDVLKLPRRKGVDEAALKGLLGYLREVQDNVHRGSDRPLAVKAG